MCTSTPLMTTYVELFFLSLLAICIYCLEKQLFKLFAHFCYWVIFLLLSCKCSLYILDTIILIDIGLANIFSHSIGHFSTLLMVSFKAQKLLILVKSSVYIFSLAVHVFISEKPLLNPSLPRFAPKLSSMQFIVLILIFRL